MHHPRFRFIIPYESDRLVHQPIRQVFPRFAIRQCRDTVRREKTRWPAIRGAADVNVEPLIQRRMLVRHPALFSDARRDVPFAKERVCVTRLLQALGNRNMLRPNRRNHVRRLRPVVFRKKFSRQVRGHAKPGWSLPREHSGPCGRTNRCCRISIGEPHPLLGQAVEMRCLHKIVTLTGEVHPAEVIGHHKQNVWPLGLRLPRLAKRKHSDHGKRKSG